MQFNQDEYVLLSRGGRVPRSRTKGPPPAPPPEPPQVVVRREVKRKSLLDSLLIAASVTRAAVIGVQDQLRNR